MNKVTNYKILQKIFTLNRIFQLEVLNYNIMVNILKIKAKYTIPYDCNVVVLNQRIISGYEVV